MKTQFFKRICIGLVTLTFALLPPAYAGFSRNSGFGGGSRGGGFKFSGGGRSSGGGVFGKSSSPFGGSRSSLSSSLMKLATQSSSRSSSRRSGGSSHSVGTNYVEPSDWDGSIFNPEVNPVIGRIINKPASELDRVSQSFGALLFSRSPIALFVDLNGNGVRGDMIDGILFNLFFGDMVGERRYQTTSTQHGTQATIEKEIRRDKIDEQIRAGLKETRIILVRKLADGREAASLRDLMDVLFSEDTSKFNQSDRETALASILTLTVLNPAIAHKTGPVVTSMTSTGITYASDLHGSLDAAIKGEKAYEFIGGGSPLALSASVARLATIMALTNEALAKNSFKLTQESLDGLRGALYFMAFELKRLKVSDEKREEILKAILAVLAKQSPKALRVAAEQATTVEALNRLESSIIKLAPVINEKRGLGRFARVTVSSIAAAASVGLWMMGGDWLVDQLTVSIGAQVLIDAGLSTSLPVGAGLATNWILKPKLIIQPLDEGIQSGYKNFCEQVLSVRL